MTDNELLLAISDMMDKKLDARLAPIENRLDRIEAVINNVEPLKKVVAEHSQKLQGTL